MGKKSLIIIAFIVVLGGVAKAQVVDGPGEQQINAGLGLSVWGLPVYAGFDIGVADYFTMGGEVSYRMYEEAWGGYGWQHNILTFSVNGNYHFTDVFAIPREWDIYGGLSLGYMMFNTTYDGPGDVADYAGEMDSDIYLVGQVGARYFFNDKMAIHMELGGGSVAGAKVGISFAL